MLTQVKCPDVATLGWIPHGDHFGPLPPPGFAAYAASVAAPLSPGRTAFAFRELFRSGNFPPPPAGWTGVNDFLGYRWLREFRGMLCLSDVWLVSRDGVPIDWSYAALRSGFCGFTPVRVRGPSGSTAVVSVPGHDLLIGPLETPLPDGVRIDYEVQYRLHWVLDGVAKRLLGLPAANAWSRCTYIVRSTGDWQIDLSGSVVPSQTSWVDWKRRYDWDLRAASDPQVRGFIQAGGQVPGPALSPGFTVTGHVDPIMIPHGP